MSEKWLNNIINLSSTGNVGVCPYCGSDDTDYKYTLTDKEESIGYADLWCNNCKRAYHISRMVVESETPNKDVPKDLNYNQ